MPSKKYLIIYGIIAIIPLIVTAIVYPTLPDTIPTHFNANNVADAYGSKGSVLFTSAIFFAMNIFIFFMTKVSVKFDTRKYSVLKIQSTYRVIMATVVFMNFISLSILYGTASYNETKPFNFLGVSMIGMLIVVAYSIYEEIKVRKLEKQFK